MKIMKSLLIIVLLSLVVQSCENAKPFQNDKFIKRHIIPINNAITMQQEFKTLRIDSLKPILEKTYGAKDFKDTQFVWFTLEDMESYINYIKAIKSANPKKDVSGVRIYFAAYPNKKVLNDRKIKHPRQQTVFMVPTVKSYNESESYKTMNHLPFAIRPDSPNNPIKGDFEIIEDLMLSHNKKRRIEVYKTNNKNLKSSFGAASSSISKSSITNFNVTSQVTAGLTSTIGNEGELSPPPPNNEH